MKIRNITPKKFQCIVGACPAVFKTDRKTLLIVGRVVSESEKRALPEIGVGKDEILIEVPRGLVPGSD